MLTAEQQKEADEKAKLEAEKAKQEALKNKGGEGGGDDDEGGDDGGDDEEEKDAAKLQANLKKARAENAKRRVKEKETQEENDRLKKALGILQGKKEGDIDPLEKAKAETDGKLRRSILKGSVAILGKDAHNPGMLLSAFQSKFKDVEVDIDTEEVDEDAVKEVIAGIKKENPWMFQSAEGDKGAEKNKGGKRAPDSGRPIGGVDHKAEWNKLKSENRHKEAQKYYAENKAAILSQL